MDAMPIGRLSRNVAYFTQDADSGTLVRKLVLGECS